MRQDASPGRDRLRYFVERMCDSLHVCAVLTDEQRGVLWAVGPGSDGAEGTAGSLVDLFPVVDADTVSQLQDSLDDADHASVTAPSGVTYHLVDGRSSTEVEGLLWYWQPVPTDRQRLAGERAELLEQAVNRFLVDLRMLGFGGAGAPSRLLPGIDALSPRERAVVDALVRGGRTVTIARDLYVSQSTVRSHLSSAFRKLGVSSQAELMERLGTGTLDLRDRVAPSPEIDGVGDGLGRDLGDGGEEAFPIGATEAGEPV